MPDVYFTDPEVEGSLFKRSERTAKAVRRNHPTWVTTEPPKRKSRPAKKSATKKATGKPTTASAEKTEE
jgi:hypothetical protein